MTRIDSAYFDIRKTLLDCLHACKSSWKWRNVFLSSYMLFIISLYLSSRMKVCNATLSQIIFLHNFPLFFLAYNVWRTIAFIIPKLIIEFYPLYYIRLHMWRSFSLRLNFFRSQMPCTNHIIPNYNNYNRIL